MICPSDAGLFLAPAPKIYFADRYRRQRSGSMEGSLDAHYHYAAIWADIARG